MKEHTRVLLDTGVFFQAARNPDGEGAAIISLADADPGIELVTSQTHLYEIGEVLARPEASKVPIKQERAEMLVKQFEQRATLERDVSPRRAPYTHDRGDDYLAALAVKSHATLVSYDQGIHNHHPANVEVMRPSEFLQQLRQREGNEKNIASPHVKLDPGGAERRARRSEERQRQDDLNRDRRDGGYGY